jgi:hypothetical protein
MHSWSDKSYGSKIQQRSPYERSELATREGPNKYLCHSLKGVEIEKRQALFLLAIVEQKCEFLNTSENGKWGGARGQPTLQPNQSKVAARLVG